MVPICLGILAQESGSPRERERGHLGSEKSPVWAGHPRLSTAAYPVLSYKCVGMGGPPGSLILKRDWDPDPLHLIRGWARTPGDLCLGAPVESWGSFNKSVLPNLYRDWGSL